MKVAIYSLGCKVNIYESEFVENLLKELKAMGFKLGVLSNKPNDATLETVKLYFRDTFDAVYGAFEALPKKPDTTVLNKLLAKLDCDKSNSIYVGDTGVDMKTGKSGELFTIGVLWGFRSKEELEENNADMIVSDANEIISYIKGR